MRVTISGLIIDGNRQLDLVYKFEKKLHSLLRETLLKFQTEDITVSWDHNTVTNCLIKNKHKKMFLVEYVFKSQELFPTKETTRRKL